jgi:hypothetical protein
LLSRQLASLCRRVHRGSGVCPVHSLDTAQDKNNQQDYHKRPNQTVTQHNASN